MTKTTIRPPSPFVSSAEAGTAQKDLRTLINELALFSPATKDVAPWRQAFLPVAPLKPQAFEALRTPLRAATQPMPFMANVNIEAGTRIEVKNVEPGGKSVQVTVGVDGKIHGELGGLAGDRYSWTRVADGTDGKSSPIVLHRTALIVDEPMGRGGRNISSPYNADSLSPAGTGELAALGDLTPRIHETLGGPRRPAGFSATAARPDDVPAGSTFQVIVRNEQSGESVSLTTKPDGSFEGRIPGRVPDTFTATPVGRDGVEREPVRLVVHTKFSLNLD